MCLCGPGRIHTIRCQRQPPHTSRLGRDVDTWSHVSHNADCTSATSWSNRGRPLIRKCGRQMSAQPGHGRSGYAHDMNQIKHRQPLMCWYIVPMCISARISPTLGQHAKQRDAYTKAYAGEPNPHKCTPLCSLLVRAH